MDGPMHYLLYLFHLEIQHGCLGSVMLYDWLRFQSSSSQKPHVYV